MTLRPEPGVGLSPTYCESVHKHGVALALGPSQLCGLGLVSPPKSFILGLYFNSTSTPPFSHPYNRTIVIVTWKGDYAFAGHPPPPIKTPHTLISFFTGDILTARGRLGAEGRSLTAKERKRRAEDSHKG